MTDNINKWRFAVDRGGTFTDVVAVDPDGFFHTSKILSASPDYNNASIEAVKKILGISSLDNEIVESIRFGTTVATNALLERKGSKVALLVTKGFKDLLEIGYQARPKIFDLHIKKPAVLYSTIVEVDERLDSFGDIVTPLDIVALERDLLELTKQDIDTVAVVLMHSWKNPVYEKQVQACLKKYGFNNVFISSEAINLIKIVTRGQSAVVDAYLSLSLGNYLDGIKKEAGSINVEFMQSSGGLCVPEDFRGKDALLSGPAGGVIAIASIAEALNLNGVIGFDMGGTSTDVSRYEGDFEKVYEQVIAGIELQKESLSINTIASGGGSILWFDGQKMKVGPESAGALPGPASYGFGGPLTITDANLLLGRLIPEYFPQTFGPGRNASLDKEIVINKFKTFAKEINGAFKTSLSIEEIALGYIRIANEMMAMAIKEISVSKGYDVREYALVCFGGAGAQHACDIARILGMKKIIFHPLSGVMSAYGIGLALPMKKKTATVLKKLDAGIYQDLYQDFETLIKTLLSELGKELAQVNVKKILDLRPQGSEAFLSVEYTTFEVTLKEFKEKFSRLYGFNIDDRQVEVVNINVEISQKVTFLPQYKVEKSSEVTSDILMVKPLYCNDGKVTAPVYDRGVLSVGDKVKGCAFIVDRYSTLIIDRGYIATVLDNGIVELRVDTLADEIKTIDLTKQDPVLLEVFNNLFMGIATEMGHTLRNTAYSVNIKERLDFSCAMFDKNGDLIANAPHIPVHLGSMTDTVKAVMEDCGENLHPGDVIVTNNPYRGGSHLPDVTVICPVFSVDGDILFYTSARGHHADIGGITPGSMPHVANHIEQEGVLIDSFKIVHNGKFQEKELIELLSKHQYPARNLHERINDIKAQIAATYKGEKELQSLIKKYGWEVVNTYMAFIQKNAEYCVRQALNRYLKNSDRYESAFVDYLDDGTEIKVKIIIKSEDKTIESTHATIDWTGTGKQHQKDNLNTPLAVTRSAILYVLRVITGEEIPLNSGCLKPVEIIVPEKSILNPVYPAPVATGNVETSQRIVDVLLGVFDVAAASQGTMNNFLFEVQGDTPYYETIGGGSGAVDGFDGASGVQVHMTNTRITDPEILEFSHPAVRLEQFMIRSGSGGKGLYRGGDGLIRELKFLKPAHISLLSERRNYQPYGKKGGGKALKGQNFLKKLNNKLEKLPHRIDLNVNAGESIIINTPGGGGYGMSSEKFSREK